MGLNSKASKQIEAEVRQDVGRTLSTEMDARRHLFVALQMQAWLGVGVGKGTGKME